MAEQHPFQFDSTPIRTKTKPKRSKNVKALVDTARFAAVAAVVVAALMLLSPLYEPALDRMQETMERTREKHGANTYSRAALGIVLLVGAVAFLFGTKPTKPSA